MYYPESYSSAQWGDLWDDLWYMYLAGTPVSGGGGGGEYVPYDPWSTFNYSPGNITGGGFPEGYNPYDILDQGRYIGNYGYDPNVDPLSYYYNYFAPYDPSFQQYMGSYFDNTGYPGYYNPNDPFYSVQTWGRQDAPYIGSDLGTDLFYPNVQQPIEPGGQVRYVPGAVPYIESPIGTDLIYPPPQSSIEPGGRVSYPQRTQDRTQNRYPIDWGKILGGVLGGTGIQNIINNATQPNGQSSGYPVVIPIPFGVSGNDPIDASQLNSLISNMLSSTDPYYMQGLNSRDWYNNWLNSTLTGNYPNEASSILRNYYNQTIPYAQDMEGRGYDYLMNQFNPQMRSNLNYLNQYGLPGNQLLQSQMNAIYPAANNLLGGTGQGYGVSDLISQIMSQGLPNQGAVESTVSPLLQYGMGQMGQASQLANQLSQGQGVMTPEQQSLLSSLMGLTQTGGLTPEYVDAMTRLVYTPTYETLLGNLNKMGGGQALLTSPVNAELQRRGMRDFQDLLLTKGFANQPQYASLATGLANQALPQGAAIMNALGNLGATGLGYGLQGFNTVANSVYPYASLGGNLATNLIGQGTNMFNSLGNLGLQNLQTINSLALSPYLAGSQVANAGASGYQNLNNQYLNYLLQNLGTQNQYTLGTNQLAGNQFQNVGNWLTQMYQTQAAQNLANQQAKWNALGMAIPGIIAGALDIWRKKPGSTTGTTGGGNTNPPAGPGDPNYLVPDYMSRASIANRGTGR